MLLARLAAADEEGVQPMTARTALALATRGGAAVLGRHDIGRLAPGLAADVIAIGMDRVEFAGALHDPLAAVVFCGVDRVTHSWVGGRRTVEDGHLVTVDEQLIVEKHNRLASALFD
jgi:cytosine/adenosine deaminase-related metal-dependent hydrolase